jgi:hypothetical protein
MNDYRPALLFAVIMTGYVEYKWWSQRKKLELSMADTRQQLETIMKKYRG